MEKAHLIDVRSDTVTLPTNAMRQAMLDCPVGDDVAREDESVNALEAFAAKLLGKEAALFVPSGTFANQCAIMTHTKPADEMIVSEDAHIIQHEAGAAARLAGVQTRTIAPRNGLYMEASEIERRIRIGDDIHYPRTALICLEQATAMGGVYPVETIKAIATLAKREGVRIHIDGARLFNAALALGVEASALAQYADSVSICLSKGLSAPVGSLLTGGAAFIDKARRNRKIMGGGMRQAGFLATAGMIALTKMVERLREDHDNAKALAKGLSAIKGIEVTRTPEINMVFFRIVKKGFPLESLAEKLKEKGILAYPPEAGEFRFVAHYGLTPTDIETVVLAMRSLLEMIKA